MEPKDDKGRNCLDFAIDFHNEEVVELILRSNSWESVLSNATKTNSIQAWVTLLVAQFKKIEKTQKIKN